MDVPGGRQATMDQAQPQSTVISKGLGAETEYHGEMDDRYFQHCQPEKAPYSWQATMARGLTVIALHNLTDG